MHIAQSRYPTNSDFWYVHPSVALLDSPTECWPLQCEIQKHLAHIVFRDIRLLKGPLVVPAQPSETIETAVQ